MVSEALQSVLYELTAFALTVKQAHWNVTGPNFRSIHLFLDEIYATIIAASDSTAERMTALGVSPNGQARDVAAEASIQPLDLGFIKDEIVVRLMADRLQLLIHSIRGYMEIVEGKDVVTADLVHGIVGDLEKHHWMLAAQLH